MKVSLRNLNILLALVCIVITAVVCMVMSITSADAALSDTNTLVENTADECFGTGDASLRAALEDYLTSVQEGASQIIVNFLEMHRTLTQKLTAEMGAYPPAVSESWDFMMTKRSSLVNQFRLFNKLGVTGVVTIGRKGQALIYFEDSRTISNPIDGYHHYFMESNNGSDYDAEAGTPTKDRTILGTAHPRTGEFVAPGNVPLTWSTDGRQTGCPNADIAFKTNGAQPVARCNVHNFDMRKGMYEFAAFTTVHGEAGVRWSHLFVMPPYVGLFMFGTWSHETVPNTKLGVVLIGLDVRAVTRELGKIKLGKGGPTSKGRLYTCAKSNWMYDRTGNPGFNQEHVLTAVSHGEATYYSHETLTVKILHAMNATDEIIRSTARHIDAIDGRYDAMANKSIHAYMISVNGTEEQFFLRAQRLNDGFGIDWWLVITLDREYMLGDIDRSTLAAQERIRDEVDSVDENLVRSRIILVVTVVVMQTSFLQMLRNLKEYRNYMPASVLVDVSATETDEESSVSDETTSQTQSRAAASSTLASPTAQHHLLTMQKLEQKKVAFSVVNVRSFFEVSHDLQSREVQAHHTEYLSTVLSITPEFNGVNDGFSGDRVMTHWNGARHCSSPKLQAAKFSHKVRTDKTLQAHKWTLSMAFVCAEVRCGNMGCEGMKKYTFLGGCVPWLHALERLNKTYDTMILHDNVTHSSVANAFYSKTIACVSYPKFRETLILSELREEMKTENEEWMYQLDKCAAANSYEGRNTAMAHIFAAQWDDAVALAQKLGDADRAEVERHCTAARAVPEEKKYRTDTALPIENI